VAPLHIQLLTNYDYYDYIRHVCTQTLVSFFYIIFICTSLPGPTRFLEVTWTRGCQGCEDTPLGGDPEHLSPTASNFYSYYLLCVLTPSQSVPFTHPSTLAKLRNLHPTSSITTPSLYYLCVLHPPSTTYASYTLPLLLMCLTPCHPLINLNLNWSTLHLFYQVWHAVLHCCTSLP